MEGQPRTNGHQGNEQCLGVDTVFKDQYISVHGHCERRNHCPSWRKRHPCHAVGCQNGHYSKGVLHGGDTQEIRTQNHLDHCHEDRIRRWIEAIEWRETTP